MLFYQQCKGSSTIESLSLDLVSENKVREIKKEEVDGRMTFIGQDSHKTKLRTRL